ncbi:MAG: hypothetical protein AB1567_08010 [bacterium]
MLRKGFYYLGILSVVLFGAIDSYGGFKDVGIGARALGMGKAVVAVCDDVDTLYWNPAGLSELGEITGMSFSHAALYGVSKANMDAFCVIQPDVYLLGGNIGLLYLAEDVVEKVADKSKKTDITETTVGLSYGKGLTFKKVYPFSLAAGGIFKFLKVEDANDKHRGYAVDMSVLMKPKYVTKDLKKIRIALSLRNILSSSVGDPSFGFKFGIATNLDKKITLGKVKIDDILFVAGTSDEKGTSLKFQCGAESIFNKKFPVRLGFYGGDIAIGLGYKGVDFEVDYAFAGYDLGNTHILSAKIKY